VKTIEEDGTRNNDLYFSMGPSLGLNISADVHGTHFSRFDNAPVSSGDVAGLQYSFGPSYGFLGFQRGGSITFEQRYFNPTFGNTTSTQAGIGIGPSSLSPWSGTVGFSYTLNLSRVARSLNLSFK